MSRRAADDAEWLPVQAHDDEIHAPAERPFQQPQEPHVVSEGLPVELDEDEEVDVAPGGVVIASLSGRSRPHLIPGSAGPAANDHGTRKWSLPSREGPGQQLARADELREEEDGLLLGEELLQLEQLDKAGSSV